MHICKISVKYSSKLNIPSTSYHLLAVQQEPYKEAYLFKKKRKKKRKRKNRGGGGDNNFMEEKSGKWTISRKMTRQKEQED